MFACVTCFKYFKSRVFIVYCKKYHLSKLVYDRSVNIMDVMMQRLEKYASNLEDLVSQRKKQILAEKMKADTLLYKLLPK